MTRVKILAIPGSLRAQSSNLSLLRAAAEEAPPGVEVVIWQGLAELPHFNPDLDVEPAPPSVAAFRALLQGAKGVLISSPEYAHGVPGSLKNALDWLVSYPDFAGKPVVLWNASAAGGEHAQSSLIEILETMSARVSIADSLLKPFLRRKLAPADELDPDAARLIQRSLSALAAAAE